MLLFFSKDCEPQIHDWINVVDPSGKPFGIFAQINNGNIDGGVDWGRQGVKDIS